MVPLWMKMNQRGNFLVHPMLTPGWGRAGEPMPTTCSLSHSLHMLEGCRVDRIMLTSDLHVWGWTVLTSDLCVGNAGPHTEPTIQQDPQRQGPLLRTAGKIPSWQSISSGLNEVATQTPALETLRGGTPETTASPCLLVTQCAHPKFSCLCF